MNTYEDFRNVVRKERENLTRMSDMWNSKINCDKGFSKEIQGRIRATVGKTRLLLSEKFKQFETLIDQSENNTSEKEISINDLQGFWDLVLIQVNEIKDIFRELEEKRAGKTPMSRNQKETDLKDVKYDSLSKKKLLSENADQTERKFKEKENKTRIEGYEK